jgi:hypothetical protein
MLQSPQRPKLCAMALCQMGGGFQDFPMRRRLTSHPLAALFPDMPAVDFAALVEDIRQHGVRVPILVYRGQILDGRQRYRACQQLNRSCPTVRWNGRDPWLEVQSRNLMRRHLAKDQIYAICKLAADQCAELTTMIQIAKAEAKRRQAPKTPVPHRLERADTVPRAEGRNKESADVIGAQLGVSGTIVKRVDRLAREAPELVQRVAAGELSVKKALAQVASQRHASGNWRAPWRLQSDSAAERIQQRIRTAWADCPIEYRAAFVTGLQNVLRELIAEQNAAREARVADFDRPLVSKAR